MAKIIVFKHSTGFSSDEFYEEEMEFHDDVTEEEITEAYIEWVMQEVGDEFTWYEKEE